MVKSRLKKLTKALTSVIIESYSYSKEEIFLVLEGADIVINEEDDSLVTTLKGRYGVVDNFQVNFELECPENKPVSFIQGMFYQLVNSGELEAMNIKRLDTKEEDLI